ncbi:MAG: DUF4402 domain-containing protein [Pseudomonadota bacterium]|nr:DUF4402 domain-containing protein [Pseudomonadota bacterium]
MFRAFALGIALASLSLPVANGLRAQGQCDNCDLPPGCRGKGNQKPKNLGRRNCQTLSVTIDSDIDFGRVVVLRQGEGRVLLDLDTGERQVLGDIDDLGGVPITGRATVTGAPFEALRISLPNEVSMRDATGGQAKMAEFVTDLPALPTLDANGQLTFQFSGTLIVTADTEASGKLRGRVPITVEYP